MPDCTSPAASSAVILFAAFAIVSPRMSAAVKHAGRGSAKPQVVALISAVPTTASTAPTQASGPGMRR